MYILARFCRNVARIFNVIKHLICESWTSKTNVCFGGCVSTVMDSLRAVFAGIWANCVILNDAV